MVKCLESCYQAGVWELGGVSREAGDGAQPLGASELLGRGGQEADEGALVAQVGPRLTARAAGCLPRPPPSALGHLHLSLPPSTSPATNFYLAPTEFSALGLQGNQD